MGKQGKKQKHQRREKSSSSNYYKEDDEVIPPPSSLNPTFPKSEEEEEEEDNNGENDAKQSTGDHFPSKFSLYQQSVQSPKGDISYLQKFFLTYVGGRAPLHFQEDFCGTALLSTPGGCDATTNDKLMKDPLLPARDIVCAFNYSCCCLHKRHKLLSYFKYARASLSRKGGIFVMDLYGGTSSECELRMQRKFPNFTYIWEQAGFDVIQRKTRISLHFALRNQHKKLRHSFSYCWRLWSLPEIKDCLEEAGFESVHFWMRQMPDNEDIKSMEGFGAGQDAKYEEVTSFEQQDSWNAYIVGVA